MKGVKYNLQFKTGINQFENHLDMSMKELQTKIKELMDHHYETDMKISNFTVYNLIKRPKCANRLLRTMCFVNKYEQPEEGLLGDEDTT
tara:strand:- start:1 stop:267 length:267 start_codon:yes stop_codon:yes gene_type:complete